MQTQTILIAGGSGLVGARLTQLLEAKGHVVRILSRTPKNPSQFYWNPVLGEMDAKALDGVDTVINLAGEGIADKRWTGAQKIALVESRVQSANVLFKAISEAKTRPKTYLSASAIGYYGNSGEALQYEEDDPVEESFMVDCCLQWEAAADKMETLGLRTVKFRIGVVLAQEGGALAEVIKPLRFGLGAYFGDGQAWWSWIHRDDVCGAFIWAAENTAVEGVFNLVAPEPVRGKALVVATAKAMKQFALFLPAPSFVLRLILGEMSAVVLNSNHISAEKLSKAGFQFKWPELNAALRDIFAPKP